MKLASLSVAIALTIASASVAAQQYKWVDKSGRTQYGDNPPPGVKATSLRGPATPPPPPPASKDAAAGKDATAAKKGPLTPAEQEQEFRKRQAESSKARDKEAKARDEAEAKKDNCNRAQESIRTIESGQRISKTDASGERVFLDDAQRAAELQKARQNARDSCSG